MRAIGSSTIGPAATNSIFSPGGSLNDLRASSGGSTGAGGMWSILYFGCCLARSPPRGAPNSDTAAVASTAAEAIAAAGKRCVCLLIYPG